MLYNGNLLDGDAELVLDFLDEIGEGGAFPESDKSVADPFRHNPGALASVPAAHCNNGVPPNPEDSGQGLVSELLHRVSGILPAAIVSSPS